MCPGCRLCIYDGGGFVVGVILLLWSFNDLGSLGVVYVMGYGWCLGVRFTDCGCVE